MSLNRTIPIRVGFVALAVLCYFATLLILAQFPTLEQAGTWSALQWLIGVLGVGVAGDTVRPSGQRASAFTVTKGETPGPNS